MDQNIFQRSFFNNTLIDYLKALAIVVGGMTALKIVKGVVLGRLKNLAANTETRFDDFLLSLIERLGMPLLYFCVFYAGVNTLQLNPTLGRGLSSLLTILATITGIVIATELVRFAVFDVFLKRKEISQSSSTRHQFQALMPAVTVIIWTVGLLFLMDNLGFKITAVMAGLGIGGVAVALAAAAVLNDMFGYFAIMFDQPFALDDFIVIGDFMGTIEKIGIKTTRIRSLGGEQLVFSNKDMTDARIRNYKRMDRRRVQFQMGVSYDTPVAKLMQIPKIIRRIVTDTPNTVFDRAHFSSFGDFNLVIEVVYCVLTADYNIYMDIQQQINFNIMREFESLGIQFASSKQNIYLPQRFADQPNELKELLKSR